MLTDNIFLYIATIAPEYYGSGFPPLRNHKVVAAAFCDFSFKDKENPIHKLGVLCTEDLEEEPILLNGISAALNECSCTGTDGKAALTTFYGRTFALPILLYRCLHHGVPLFLPSTKVELADVLTMHNVEIANLRVTDAATLIGMPERYNIDVATRFHEKDFGTLKSSVALDLLISVMVFLRLQWIGEPYFASPNPTMPLSDWRSIARKSMESFYALYKEKPEVYQVLSDYIKSIDLKKVLLANQR